MAVDPEESQSAATSSCEEEDYFSEVESTFVNLRGSPLFITPKDWQLVQDWRQMQIPLRIVKDGLRQVFDRPRPGRPIRHLSYCRQTVEAAYRRHREALAGVRSEASTQEDDDRMQSYLVRLERELRNASHALDASHATLAELAERSAERLARLCAEPISAEIFQKIESELGRMDEELLGEAETCLDETAKLRCTSEAERSLEHYRARMPDDVYRSAVRSAYLKRVRAHFGLPALSLFYI